MYTKNIFNKEYKKNKLKYLILKKRLKVNNITSNSKIIALAKKDKQNYRVLITEAGNTYYFYEKSFGEFNKDELTKDLRFKNINKILVIDSIDQFDIFTNKYGSLKVYTSGHSDYKNGQIFINWNKVSNDYKGFYLDYNNELKMRRYTKAPFGSSLYNSWWQYEYRYYDAIIFH